MPITKTSDGLLLIDELENESYGYGTYHDYCGTLGYYVLSKCTTAKMSGAASLRGDLWNDTGQACPNGSEVVGWYPKTINVGSGSGRRFHIMEELVSGPGTSGVDTYTPFSVGGSGSAAFSTTTHGWKICSGSISDDLVGSQPAIFAYVHTPGGHGGGGLQAFAFVDHLVICKNDLLTVTSLTSAMKVEVYQGTTLIGTATVVWGGTQAQVDISSVMFPSSFRLKIYQADGTVFETTPYYIMCGGDVWDWNPNNGTLSINAAPFIIYRQASLDTPKTATITATLLKPNGNKYAGKTITFSAMRGSVVPTSAVTNTLGQASTAISASEHGIAIAKAEWAGDAVAPAARVFITVHVFEDAEVADPTKQFQFFNQGIEFAFTDGEYAVNGEAVTEPFQVTLSAWDSRLTNDGLVSIYRKGVKEFGGILKIPKRTIGSRSVTLSGSDASILLSDRDVDVESFPAWYPQDILTYLLAKYPTCITAGTLGAYANYVSLMFTTEDLRATIQRLCLLVGWTFRINADLSLDFAETFGTGVKSVEFTEGDNLTGGDRADDYTSIANVIRMKGDGITSMRSDADSIFAVGVHELPAFQATISDQATLDIACAALLAQKKNAQEQITIEVVDYYAVGTWAPEDSVTVTAPSIEAAGSYVVKRIHRKMTDANYARLELTSRKQDEWEYDSEYKRMVKDATVLV
jgi:hypothetical protein